LVQEGKKRVQSAGNLKEAEICEGRIKNTCLRKEEGTLAPERDMPCHHHLQEWKTEKAKRDKEGKETRTAVRFTVGGKSATTTANKKKSVPTLGKS